MAKKLYYKIGEACKILDIQPYVLRYWEKEFPLLSPNKSRSGQRVYNERELGIIRRIKELLYEEGYTIAGAKKKLESELADDEAQPAADGGTENDASPDRGTQGPEGRTPEGRTPDGRTPDGRTPDGRTPDGRTPDGAPEALERLRSGVEEALGQARKILAKLESAGT